MDPRALLGQRLGASYQMVKHSIRDLSDDDARRMPNAALWYDAVNLFVDTNSAWYQGLPNSSVERGLRAIHRTLTARRLM